MNLRRNTVYSAAGFALPTLVILLAYPIVLRHLGEKAMGLYLLASTVSGSLAFLEFGVSTATVKLLAEKAASRGRNGAADVVATSLAFYGGLGAVGLVAFWFLAPVLAKWSGTGPELEQTAVLVLRIAALQFVPSYLTGVFASVFKGLHRFEYSTLVGSLQTVLVWGGAVVGVRHLGWGVVGVTALGAAGSLFMCVLSGWLAFRLGRAQGLDLHRGRPGRAALRGLLQFGVFMAINGVAGVFMLQVQTWLIAAMLGASAVTIFSTALQITSKINGLMGTMFEPLMPVAASIAAARTRDGLRSLRAAYDKAMVLSLVLALAAGATLYAFSPWFIGIWLRSSIDAQVVEVIRILCLGLAVNGATPVPYHLMNGMGRPEINTAFMVAGIVLFYGILAALWTGGLSLNRFALAMSSTFVLNGIAFLVFAELVVWRKWLATGRDVEAGASTP